MNIQNWILIKFFTIWLVGLSSRENQSENLENLVDFLAFSRLEIDDNLKLHKTIFVSYVSIVRMKIYSYIMFCYNLS